MTFMENIFIGLASLSALMSAYLIYKMATTDYLSHQK